MLNIIKIGGNIIDNEAELTPFLKDFATISNPKILVHGGGKLTTRLADKLGIQTTMIDGRRVTDADTLQIATMVYAGWINKSIVAQLQSVKCNAIGLSGADANLVPAVRRPAEPIDFGFVGDIQSHRISVKMLKDMFERSLTPVFCSITHDGKGSLLNSNADSIASALAVAMAGIVPVRLVFCFEKNGVLTDVDNDDSYIRYINPEKYQILKEEGVISQGMIPKLDNAFNALRMGVKEVQIKHAKNVTKGIGTVITLDD